MPGFGVSFSSAANALSAIQQALDAVQNNVVNANTPGYAAQRVNFSAQGFDPNQGLIGGVDVSLSSTRDLYLEQAVRKETSSLGLQEQKNSLLTGLQKVFSASGDSGIPDALSSFASSFATLSAAPNDPTARSGVLQAASGLADAFNHTSAQITQLATDATQEANSVVSQINQLSARLADLNSKIQNGGQKDAGLAADLNNSLERLSELANISVSQNPDGGVSVLLNGQTPLVLGTSAFALAVRSNIRNPDLPNPTGDAGIAVVDGNGADLTGQIKDGKLGALLEFRNQTVSFYLGDQSQVGELNRLASSFAARANTIITDAQTAEGSTISPLFVFGLADSTKAAASLGMGTITPAQLVTSDGVTANGAANELADILDPANSLDRMAGGETFGGFYSSLAAQAGSAASKATSDLATQQSVTAQAQNQRTQGSGVSLNDQAAQLLSLQQAYQATARIITILTTLSQTAVNIIPQA